jgi:hypothetical protein
LSAERVVGDPVAFWTSNAFFEQARAWVATQLARRGSRATLVRWVALARSTGCVTHAISWEKALQDAPEHGHGRGVPSSRMVAGATRAVGADFGNAASTPGLSRARGSLRRGR